MPTSLPAAVHRDLMAYAEVLSWTTGQAVSGSAKLIAAMIARFMATGRAFVKARHSADQLGAGSAERSG
jgi:hypothetical protein